ncbi:MAG: type I DNA topoisomerase [Patescibacteria group bacterium]|jgi:DNA topoisomerase-1|nr:type I DNA topoisomerase [Patescibacteria group bacterium]
MADNLVIVESPTKAKTISQFLGPKYQVLSSYGHIRDLPKNKLNIEIENNFKPLYQVPEDKKKIVSKLKKESKGKKVWLASDEDREGEAIAWHLTTILGIDTKLKNRIVFHEITKGAIQNALLNPRNIDLNLVNAQQARRVLDRIVGYQLSPVLWKKIRPGLSAGRVQSVAVRLIVDREREINNSQRSSTYKIVAEFKVNNVAFRAELNKKIKNYQEAKNYLSDLKNATFSIQNISSKPSFKNPSAPFTTSTLQQVASQKMGYSVKYTMNIAQKLYENGYITYMRTDSTNLSKEAIKDTKQYIIQNFGQNYLNIREYKTKSTNAQEAHEAIRPTNLNLEETPDQSLNKLYKLIRNRLIASQMSKAESSKKKIDIKISNKNDLFVAEGETLKFDGFLKIYENPHEDKILPNLELNQNIKPLIITTNENFSKLKPRYNEASLVRKLEELGIGRPSTYAPTISVIQNRGYVQKKDIDGINQISKIITLKDNQIIESDQDIVIGADKNKLCPNPIAELTIDFLVDYFPEIVDYKFTAKVEKDFDKIANGKIEWQKIIKSFYEELKPQIDKIENIPKKDISKMRLIGNDPYTNEPIYSRLGRYGPMLQKGDGDNEKSIKPQFAPLPEGVTLENVTLDQALEAFKLPRVVGKTKDNKEINANIGKFGPYIQIDKMFISIKNHDPKTIDLPTALEIYNEHLENLKKKIIKEFDDKLKIINGPYGPYLTNGKKNSKLPKDINPKTITKKQAQEILKNSVSKPKFKKRKHKK